MNKLSSMGQIKLYRAKPLLPTSHEALAKNLKLFTPDHDFNRLSFTLWFKKDEYVNILEKMNRIGWLADEIDHHP